MKFIITVIASCLIAVLLSLIVFSPGKCENEDLFDIFHFQHQGSTALSYVEKHCENCNTDHGISRTTFRGNPTNISYLETLIEHSDGEEIIGGEYYTITAIVTLPDFDLNKTRIKCKVESANTIVLFSVEFKEGFEDSVGLLQEGDEITFRGRYYDVGCGFTDCELL